MTRCECERKWKCWCEHTSQNRAPRVLAFTTIVSPGSAHSWKTPAPATRISHTRLNTHEQQQWSTLLSSQALSKHAYAG